MASIAAVANASTASARHLWWSASTTAAQIPNALTRLSKTILITNPTVPEKALISRVGSERALVPALDRELGLIPADGVLRPSSCRIASRTVVVGARRDGHPPTSA